VVTYVITLPSARQLTIHDVHVTENGNSVVQPTITPASQTGKKTFGTILVLDTSYSMNGQPLAAALAAENAFVAQRNPNEQVGAIDFNHTSTPVLPLTTSSTKIQAALGRTPAVATGTHIYDAVAQAEAILTRAGISAGSIVVLSDGADTGSTDTLAHVAQTAHKANIRIYTIGLRDSTYKPGTLEALASAGGGQYAEAEAQDLPQLFKQLGEQLSDGYLLQYKSPAGPDQPVRVQVEVNGIGIVGSQYRTPALTATTTVPAPYNSSIGSRIWGSAITMIVLALFAAGVLALLLIVLLEPKRSTLPSRMAEFVSIRGLQRDNGQPVAENDPNDQDTLWTRFERTLEIASINAAPETIIAGAFAGTALTFLLIYAATGSWWWSLFALGVPYLVREWVVRTLARRRTRFAEQLPDALQVVASALRSGHSFAGALAVVVESASEPMKSEMQRVVADEQLGVPVQRSLGVVADRMASSDIEQLALVAELQREAGGNAAEVIDRVAETVRERFDLRRLVQTLTMQGRMSRWIVSALPVAIIVLLQISNPHYLHPLLASTAGKVVFGLAAAWAVAGSYAIKRIVEIEV
jgi:tight adherence protein B